MTNHQEEELFRTLGNLVGGVQRIQRTLDDHTKKLDDHTKKLDDHTKKLDDHTKKLDDHTKKLDEHSVMLNYLVSKTDSIAGQVMENDRRVSSRITSVETAIGNLGGEIN